jgi:hypothetical protein
VPIFYSRLNLAKVKKPSQGVIRQFYIDGNPGRIYNPSSMGERMKKLICLVLFMICSLNLSACGIGQPFGPTVTPTPLPTLSGPGQIIGIVQDTAGKPAPVSIFVTSSLPTATPDPALADKGPQFNVKANEDGSFVMSNVPPGEYTLFFMDNGLHIKPANSLRVSIKPGEVIDLGIVILQ